jgi:ATP-dependent DNA helicase RecQ
LGSANKERGIEEAALRGDYLIVYLTPEKLCSDGFLDKLAPLVERNGILLLAVDEAHCVSAVQTPTPISRHRYKISISLNAELTAFTYQWGHDFRKEYRNIGIFRRKFNRVLSVVELLHIKSYCVVLSPIYLFRCR